MVSGIRILNNRIFFKNCAEYTHFNEVCYIVVLNIYPTLRFLCRSSHLFRNAHSNLCKLSDLHQNYFATANYMEPNG